MVNFISFLTHHFTISFLNIVCARACAGVCVCGRFLKKGTKHVFSRQLMICLDITYNKDNVLYLTGAAADSWCDAPLQSNCKSLSEAFQSNGRYSQRHILCYGSFALITGKD